MHRDFQSRNLMVHQGRLWLIDFQGMRFGPPAYDLAGFDRSLREAARKPYSRVSLNSTGRLLGLSRGEITGVFEHTSRPCGFAATSRCLGPTVFSAR